MNRHFPYTSRDGIHFLEAFSHKYQSLNMNHTAEKPEYKSLLDLTRKLISLTDNMSKTLGRCSTHTKCCTWREPTGKVGRDCKDLEWQWSTKTVLYLGLPVLLALFLHFDFLFRNPNVAKSLRQNSAHCGMDVKVTQNFRPRAGAN